MGRATRGAGIAAAALALTAGLAGPAHADELDARIRLTFRAEAGRMFGASGVAVATGAEFPFAGGRWSVSPTLSLYWYQRRESSREESRGFGLGPSVEVRFFPFAWEHHGTQLAGLYLGCRLGPKVGSWSREEDLNGDGDFDDYREKRDSNDVAIDLQATCGWLFRPFRHMVVGPSATLGYFWSGQGQHPLASIGLRIGMAF